MDQAKYHVGRLLLIPGYPKCIRDLQFQYRRLGKFQILWSHRVAAGVRCDTDYISQPSHAAGEISLMWYAIWAEGHTDSRDKRATARPAHVARLEQLKDTG